MPRKFTEDEADYIKEALIDEGIKQFSLYGSSKVTVDQLSETIGISKGAFYLFYSSKEVLFQCCLEVIQSRINDDIRAMIESCRQRPERAIKQVIGYALELQGIYKAFDQKPNVLKHVREGAERVVLRPHIDGKLLIESFNAVGCTCDFSSEAVEEVLMHLGHVDMHKDLAGNSSGYKLLVDVCAIGLASYIRI